MAGAMLMRIWMHALFPANHKRVLWRLPSCASEARVCYPGYEVLGFVLLLSVHVVRVQVAEGSITGNERKS